MMERELHSREQVFRFCFLVKNTVAYVYIRGHKEEN